MGHSEGETLSCSFLQQYSAHTLSTIASELLLQGRNLRHRWQLPVVHHCAEYLVPVILSRFR